LLGAEAKEAISWIVGRRKDEDAEVRENAVSALMQVDADGCLISQLVKEPDIRGSLIQGLRRIGEPARRLRQELQRRWQEGRVADFPGGAEVGEIEDRSSSESKTRLSPEKPSSEAGTTSIAHESKFHHLAFGMEAGNRWHVFKKYGKEWRHQGPLKGVAKGRQEELLAAFAEGEGYMSKDEALKLAGKSSLKNNKMKLFSNIKSELSHLRQLIRKTAGLPEVAKGIRLDPLRWERSSHGWRAEVSIGYAITKDDDHIDSNNRLRFKLYHELTQDERIDSQP
jgi:hypothetical protein